MIPSNCQFIMIPNTITIWERNFLAKKNLQLKNDTDRVKLDQDNKITINCNFKNPIKDFHFNIMIRNN
jgi:hypothetical protein